MINLRPFRPKLAEKDPTSIILEECLTEVTFVGFGEIPGNVAIKVNDRIRIVSAHNLRQKPLTYVQGTAVYEGDTLYNLLEKEWQVVYEVTLGDSSHYSWEKPKGPVMKFAIVKKSLLIPNKEQAEEYLKFQGDGFIITQVVIEE